MLLVCRRIVKLRSPQAAWIWQLHWVFVNDNALQISDRCRHLHQLQSFTGNSNREWTLEEYFSANQAFRFFFFLSSHGLCRSEMFKEVICAQATSENLIELAENILSPQYTVGYNASLYGTSVLLFCFYFYFFNFKGLTRQNYTRAMRPVVVDGAGLIFITRRTLTCSDVWAHGLSRVSPCFCLASVFTLASIAATAHWLVF